MPARPSILNPFINYQFRNSIGLWGDRCPVLRLVPGSTKLFKRISRPEARSSRRQEILSWRSDLLFCFWSVVLWFSSFLLMYVGVVELLRNLPLYGGGFVSPLIRDLEYRRHVLTGQSVGWALANTTSRRSLRLLCGGYGQIEYNSFVSY